MGSDLDRELEGFESELLSLWAEDLALERSILGNLLSYGQIRTEGYIRYLNSLTDMCGGHGTLDKYGKCLQLQAPRSR